VRFFRHPAYEPWCRDHGPIFLKRSGGDEETAIVDWDYNAWGGKYPPHDLDDAVPTRIAELLGLPVYAPGMILEGGSIEVNGDGALLTTTSCLLNPNRNPSLSKETIEQRMRDYLGVRQILWLGDGIEGDDTDGHVDTIARLVDEHTIAYVACDDRSDTHYASFAALEAELKKLLAGGVE
jgi:agmatine deiminase